MIKISKEEAAKVRQVYPNAEIYRTVIQKSKRHSYYLCEREIYLRLIARSNSVAAQRLAEIRGGSGGGRWLRKNSARSTT